MRTPLGKKWARQVFPKLQPLASHTTVLCTAGCGQTLFLKPEVRYFKGKFPINVHGTSSCLKDHCGNIYVCENMFAICDPGEITGEALSPCPCSQTHLLLQGGFQRNLRMEGGLWISMPSACLPVPWATVLWPQGQGGITPLCQPTASRGAGGKGGGRGPCQPPLVAGAARLLTALGLVTDMKENNNQAVLVSPLPNPRPGPGSAGNSRHFQRRQNVPGDAVHDDPVHTQLSAPPER